MTIDPAHIIRCSRQNVSNLPVMTARYTLVVIMNEDNPDEGDELHRQAFAAEFQRALDDGYFQNLRYDAMEFDVVSREVLDTAPANEPELQVAPLPS